VVIQIGFTFLVLAYPGSPGKGPLNGCVCVCVCVWQQRETSAGRVKLLCIVSYLQNTTNAADELAKKFATFGP